MEEALPKHSLGRQPRRGADVPDERLFDSDILYNIL